MMALQSTPAAQPMDVQTVLVSVQERDKWRHRLEILQTSLREVRERQRRAVARLRRLKRELLRLQEVSEAVGGIAARIAPLSHRIHAQTHPTLPAR